MSFLFLSNTEDVPNISEHLTIYQQVFVVIIKTGGVKYPYEN